MLRLVLSSVILLSGAVELSAAESRAFELSAEVGKGRYGLVGVEVGVYPASDWQIHIGGGVGSAAMFGAGIRYYTTETECFLFKQCKDSLFFDGTLVRSLWPGIG